MKLELIFLIFVSACSASILPGKHAIQEFANGFCSGVTGTNGFLDLNNCLQNKESIWDSLVHSISKLSNFNYLLKHFAQTMIELTGSVVQLVKDISPCVRTGSLLQAMLDVTSNLSPPKLFVQATKAMIMKSSFLLGKLKEIYNASVSRNPRQLGKSLAEFILSIFVTKYFSSHQ
eukprot:TRINITY_DN2099_c0_g8_i2.p1 TRINITY_DN2099_c0_g8~~TRINITY_DN2099_c0_g8_i2.p1  ORF type:complete len:175 (+),score=22.12 TRINITY_DN2099_c0_g8_i2:50-574(+)